MYYITLFIPILIFKRKKGREGDRERRRERKNIMKEKEGQYNIQIRLTDR